MLTRLPSLAQQLFWSPPSSSRLLAAERANNNRRDRDRAEKSSNSLRRVHGSRGRGRARSPIGHPPLSLFLHVDEDDDDAAVRAAILRKDEEDDDENQFLPACLSVSLGIIAFLCSPRLPLSIRQFSIQSHPNYKLIVTSRPLLGSGTISEACYYRTK